MASEGMNALGAIETFGLVWVLEAGDAMCKAGDVELIGYENTASGYNLHPRPGRRRGVQGRRRGWREGGRGAWR